MRLLAVTSAVLSALATSTAAVHGPEFFLYLTTHYEHNAWVPVISDYAPAAALASLLTHAVAQWYAQTQLEAAGIAFVSTLVWTFASAELCRDFGNTLPGPAVYLGWAAILIGNWGIGYQPKPTSGL